MAASDSGTNTSFPTLSGPTVKRTRAPHAPKPSQASTAAGRFSQTQSTVTDEFYQPQIVQTEPSYRMAPDDPEKFNVSLAERYMKDMLVHYLENQKYEPKACAQLSKVITERIRNKSKECRFSARYRYICQVTIGENKRQGFHSVSRSCWNPETDNFASVNYQNGHIYAIAILFATYFD